MLRFIAAAATSNSAFRAAILVNPPARLIASITVSSLFKGYAPGLSTCPLTVIVLYSLINTVSELEHNLTEGLKEGCVTFSFACRYFFPCLAIDSSLLPGCSSAVVPARPLGAAGPPGGHCVTVCRPRCPWIGPCP